MAAPTKTILGHCMGLFSWRNSRMWKRGTLCSGCHGLKTTAACGDSTDHSLAKEFRKATGRRRGMFRTGENDPTRHTEHQHGLFYSVSPDDFQRWWKVGLHPSFYEMLKAFNENMVMIRHPALEVFNCLRVSQFNLPVIRYLLYGRHGTGKSTTLAHIMHSCGRQGWVIVHIPWAPYYNYFLKERHPNSHNASRVDCPIEGAEWLSYFQTMNEEVLSKLDLRVQNKYVWSKRESTEPGTPWLDLIEYGLTRTKYSCDVMGALLKEIREQSSQQKLRTLVAIEGIHALWQPTTIYRIEDTRQMYEPEEITVIHNLRKMVQNNWCGGAVVGTVDVNAAPKDRRGSYLPRHILEKEALDVLDPHIPIHVQDYSEKEVHSCIDYYTDRKWIQNPAGSTDEGKKEMIFLSCKNPLELYRITTRW